VNGEPMRDLHRHRTVGVALGLGADVGEDRVGGGLGARGLLGVEPVQARAGRRQEVVDGPARGAHGPDGATGARG
jgi:hypothetical protein